MKIEGAIFDLDGTMIDSLFYWDRLWEKLGEKYLGDKSFRPGLDMEKAVRTITFRDAAKMLFDTFALGGGADEIYDIMHDFCLEIYHDEATFKPGAKELLDHLKSKGVKMCVASASMPDLLRAIFDRFELDEYFPKIISCADVGKGKSHPDVFFAAETYMGTKHENTWVFEDSIVALQTAQNAGFKTVGVYDENNFGIDCSDVATEYIGQGDSFVRLIEKIK